MQRIVFSLIEGWRHRHLLRHSILRIPTCLMFNWDNHTQYKVVILDFDGVLAGHGATHLTNQVAAWLERGQQRVKIYILSNQPSQTRIDYFKAHFPEIVFFVGPTKKPYPESIELIMQQEKVQPADVALLDDRLLTGILAAVLTGVTGILITKPTVDWHGHFYKEVLFTLLRKLEHLLLFFMTRL